MSSIALPANETTTSLRASSTGPRTPEGKSCSSQNARKHNLAATTPPPDLQNDPDYQIRTCELRGEWNPNTPTQHYLLDQLAFTAWKLEQVPKLERQILATPLHQKTPADLPPRAPRTGFADHFEDQVNADAPPPPDPTVSITAHHLLQNAPTPLTRLWDHHRRLQSRFQSLIRQLQRLHNPPTRKSADDEYLARNAAGHAALADLSRDLHDRQRAQDQRLAQVEQEPPDPAKECQTTPTGTAAAPAQNELPPSIPHPRASADAPGIRSFQINEKTSVPVPRPNLVAHSSSGY